MSFFQFPVYESCRSLIPMRFILMEICTNMIYKLSKMIILKQYYDCDWNAICELHDKGRLDELRGSCDLKAFVPFENLYNKDMLRKYSVYLAIKQTVAVGFTGIINHYIIWLYVDSGHCCLGIGRRLLRKAVEIAGPKAYTYVFENNISALNLYTSEGFRIVKSEKTQNAGYPCVIKRLELKT